MDQNKNCIKLEIAGMHCKSCELLIEGELSQVPGVKHVKVDHHKGLAEIFYNEQAPDQEKLKQVVKEAGYMVGQAESLPLINHNPLEYIDLGVAVLILIILYLILQASGLGGLVMSAASGTAGASAALIVGLAAGFSTCMALVGGLVLGMSAEYAKKHPEATSAQKFRPHIYFNLGRILGFGFLGGLLGIMGSIFQLSGTIQGALAIIIGAIMLIVGLQLTNIFPRLEKFKFSLPKSIGKFFGLKTHEKEYSHSRAVLLGLATFFLPCGFTQAMQLLAINSGSFVRGALIMSMFALGTAPGLLGVGGLTSVVKGAFANKFFKFAGVAVIAFSLFNIVNGYRLTGLSFGASNTIASNQQSSVAVSQNNYQVIHMTQTGHGYTPNVFTVRKGVPVKWIIDSQNQYSCDSSIVVSTLGIKKALQQGENVVEFTPGQAGVINFSCSMGMFTGQFNVI